MNVNYNEIEKSIEIKDGVKNDYFVMKFLMILNSLNAVLRLLNLKETGIGFQEIIWFVLGIASLIVFYLFFCRRTTLEKIPVNEIEGLKEKSILGRSRFLIKLINEKKETCLT